MSASVTLFTDRLAFETAWKPVLEGLGVGVSTARPEHLPDRLERDSALVVDASAGVYDEDELLAHLGLARAMGAMPAVMLPPNDVMASVDELVDDLCGGLVARTADDVLRVSSILARRMGARRARRFEYLTVSPRGGDLLAILADGSAILLARPADPQDDRSDIASITLSEDAQHASLELASGARFDVRAEDVVLRTERRSSNGTVVAGSAAEQALALGEIDGQRLGAKIRALRLAAGLTQAELARRTGIHRPNIARVEAGRHTPSLETLARLATAIGVPTTRVLIGD